MKMKMILTGLLTILISSPAYARNLTYTTVTYQQPNYYYNNNNSNCYGNNCMDCPIGWYYHPYKVRQATTSINRKHGLTKRISTKL